MQSNGSDWYRKIWTLDIMEQSWVEDTVHQVDFIMERLGLRPGDRVLDLACGFGRHSIELARRGCSVVGVDITPDYVAHAASIAEQSGLDAQFILSDIRDIAFDSEFDAVISMGDGAVGYLENDEENLKIFDVIARALKPCGRHLMDIMNADYAERHFPCQLWDAGERCLTLSKFEWDSSTRIMMYGQQDFLYGQPLSRPVIDKGNPTRLYSLAEVESIMSQRGMEVVEAFSDFNAAPASPDGIQLVVCSQLRAR